MKNCLLTVLAIVATAAVAAQDLEHDFLNPKDEYKPIIIWQWMDGLVTREGITADLEAFKEAGLAGVQNFQIGGPEQIRVSDTTFTCWPLKAWQDDPQSLKAVCDRAFCTGVNRIMLHAGAANPWLNVEPGMSFGIWGTQFVPKQTWWKVGGAKELFGYMARCSTRESPLSGGTWTLSKTTMARATC